MDLNKIKDTIKRNRTDEAIRKGYLGPGGKIFFIASKLGNPIYEQKNSNDFFQDDPFYSFDDELPTFEEEDYSYEIGYLYDGLSHGSNLSISTIDFLAEIKVKFQGEIVYHELSNELESYVPGEWEKKIEELYNFAEKIERKNRPEARKQILERSEKKRSEILEELKKKWGFE